MCLTFDHGRGEDSRPGNFFIATGSAKKEQQPKMRKKIKDGQQAQDVVNS